MGKNKNNGLKLWEILEEIIGKTESIIGSGLLTIYRMAQMFDGAKF